MNKLDEIFRNNDETHKEALTHNIKTFCGDKLLAFYFLHLLLLLLLICILQVKTLELKGQEVSQGDQILVQKKMRRSGEKESRNTGIHFQSSQIHLYQ